MDARTSQTLIGDCLDVLPSLPRGRVDLAYLDPPFFTQKQHTLAPRSRDRSFTFSDIWSSAVEFGEFLLQRVRAVHAVLADHGSIFLHCDRNSSHIGRAILDAVFGSENLRSEIIWTYRRWSNARRGLLPSHQTILYYTKGGEFTFNDIREEYSPATNVDQILQRRMRDRSNKVVYARDKTGQVVTSGEKAGVPLSDVWDIPYLNPKAKERVGYPTQKPLDLLERIIRLASNPGDCVLDPFCGSGTTLVAAKLLDREAVGIDVSAEAIELTRSRLARPIKSESRLLDIGRESYRQVDAEAIALLAGADVVPVQRNSGIDALCRLGNRGSPVPIRVQRKGECLFEAAERLHRAALSKGAKLMFLVVVDRQSCRRLFAEIPPEVKLIDAAGLSITAYLEEVAGQQEHETAAVRAS